MADDFDCLGVENRAALEAVLASGSAAPVALVNFLKFRENAAYERDRAEASMRLTGRQAYQRYVAGSQPVLAERGATTMLFGSGLLYAVGEGDWDALWINRYPNPAALAATVADRRLIGQLYHRAAGVERQHNIVVVKLAEGLE